MPFDNWKSTKGFLILPMFRYMHFLYIYGLVMFMVARILAHNKVAFDSHGIFASPIEDKLITTCIGIRHYHVSLLHY
jgi:hypothetical protein